MKFATNYITMNNEISQKFTIVHNRQIIYIRHTFYVCHKEFYVIFTGSVPSNSFKFKFTLLIPSSGLCYGWQNVSVAIPGFLVQEFLNLAPLARDGFTARYEPV